MINLSDVEPENYFFDHRFSYDICILSDEDFYKKVEEYNEFYLKYNLDDQNLPLWNQHRDEIEEIFDTMGLAWIRGSIEGCHRLKEEGYFGKQ